MNYEETLSTLKAIQASYSPMPFLLDPDAEPRFVINSDERTITIPEEFKFLAVKMDHLSERIYFDIPRYFDGEDLATKICVVQYINANGDEAVEGIAAIVDVDYTSESGKIIFRWDVDNNVTKYAGDVSFSVRFYTISDDNRFTYSWNTVPATLPILDTIDNTGRTVTENYPTELLQWQYRMTELDRTISEKIADATEAIDADVTAAQNARKGAEDAETRVNAIVASNEAYTKQQSHDLFALALKEKTESSKSLTICPDSKSTVVANVFGFTKQDGSGDPSYDNVRKITVLGRKFLEVELTGDETIETSLTNDGRNFYRVRLSNIDQVGEFIPMSGDWSSKSMSTVFRPGNPYVMPGKDCVCSGKQDINSFNEIRIGFEHDPGTVSNVKQWLSNRKALGTPFVVYCPLVDESHSSGVYVTLNGDGAKYSGICSKLTSPLCEGDSFESNVSVNCDKSYTFDGSDDESWSLETLSGTVRRYWISLDSEVAQADSTVGVAYSNWLTLGIQGGTVNPSLRNVFTITGDHRLYVRCKNETLEDFKAKLKLNPIFLVCRTTSYSEEKDIRVSMEKHQRQLIELTGQETVTVGGVGAYLISGVKPSSGNTGGNCSHYKYLYSYTGGGILVDTSGQIALGTALISEKGYKSVSDWKNDLQSEYAKGTPVQIVYKLSTPISYVHRMSDFTAHPDEDGNWVITGEPDGTVSVEYNKNVAKALEDILTRVSALEG